MTDDTAFLPVLADDRWLVKLCEGWRLPWIVALQPFGPRLCIYLWRPI